MKRICCCVLVCLMLISIVSHLGKYICKEAIQHNEDQCICGMQKNHIGRNAHSILFMTTPIKQRWTMHIYGHLVGRVNPFEKILSNWIIYPM